MTRVLAVIHGPAYGGAHNQIVRLAPALMEYGVEFLAVLPEEATPVAERMRKSGVETVTMPLHRLRATPDPRVQGRFVRRFRAELRALRELIVGRGVDVVQVHGVTNPHGAIAARATGAAVAWQLFDTRAPMALRRVAMPLVVRLADVITTWGRELARVHPGAETLGPRCITVYPPVDLDAFKPDGDRRDEARRLLGLSNEDRVVMSVGVLNPQKGHEHLIRATSMAKSRHGPLKVRILGASSPAHATYERGLHEMIDRLSLGDVVDIVDPGGDVPLLMQACDLFAMSSVPRSEGMPTAILEAMACGKPVISTNVAAVSELVEDGITGTLVRPLDDQDLACALDEVIADSSRRVSMGSAGLDRARAEFGLSRLAELHARAYGMAIDHRDRRLQMKSS